MALEGVPEVEPASVDKNKQTEPNTALLRAARGGRLDTVLQLLDSGAVTDIDTCNSNGLNALHLAAKDGHCAVVDELLRRGATVDAATKKGNTALHIACLAGQEDVARALLAAGASPDAQSAAGFTPLYMAAQENHAGCVRLLLAAGASQTLATQDGFTPLAVAMQQGHERVVAELLECDARGKVRLPALHIAAKKNDVKAATLLLEKDHDPDACSKSGFTPLHIAAHYGNVGVARALLAAGADPSRQAKHHITPLHVACKWGQLGMAELLLEQGAGVGAGTRDGLTPLHCAARSGHAALATALVRRGANIGSKTKNGLTPLHMSVQGEHADTARALLAEGAAIDDVTVDYLTSLHVAAHCGHVHVARLLLERNADANARALNGFTPLHIACKKNRLKIVELLLRSGASKAATTESGLTPLHVAAFMGCMNIAIHLLQAGADPDAATARGETPLHLATRAQQLDVVRILLRHGAKTDARARRQQSALHVAARLGHADIASLLLQHGADPAALTKDDYTPLHIAAKEGKEEVASTLVEQGAPLEARTRKGFTPLHLAAKYGHAGVARALLRHGAQADARGNGDITPLHMATYYGHPDIALLLLDKGASPHSLARNGHSALHVACSNNHPDIAFALLEHGAEAGVRSSAGFTPLHMAARAGHEDCVEMLLERGADASAQANNRLTPLHLAAAEGRTGVLTTLLAAGAKCDAQSGEGYTPLHTAAHHGQAAAARALLASGADVHARAAHGYTPLHQAAQQGHTLLVTMLLQHGANPDDLTDSGHTACAIAERLGYISTLEALRPVTQHTLSQAAGDSGGDGKYRAAAPELMHDTFLSDSEDEGGEVECEIQQQQQYRYMATESGTLSRAQCDASATDGHRWPSNNEQHSNNQQPLPNTGFLVSFIVDARGGAMQARRRGGARVVVPPGACVAPTRLTIRPAARRAPAPPPPPLMEGEALACRLLELQPHGAKFQAPVVLEVPIYCVTCRERELVVLRSDTGDTWQDHALHIADNPALQEAAARERERDEVNEHGERVARIVTQEFPHYLAVVTRVRQDVHVIGAEGGTISSRAVPQAQALFPPQALTKRIRVGLQAHAAPASLRARILPRDVAVSPVLTVEPRRRKFHRTITLTMPLPKHHDPNATAPTPTNNNSLRLLCSIMGGQARAVWEDVTGSTPLSVAQDTASFTTTVSARFWLMDCRNVAEASRLATDLYREMLLVWFEARLVVLAQRLDACEARLLLAYLTDRSACDALLDTHSYTQVAQSTSVELRDGTPVFLEFSGNLVPVTKSGEQPSLKFEAFKENRAEFVVRLKRDTEPAQGRIYFMNEPKTTRAKAGGGGAEEVPVCVLDVTLPSGPGKQQHDCLTLDQSGFDALKDELWGDSSRLSPVPAHLTNGHAANKSLSNGHVVRENGHNATQNGGGGRATFDSDEERTPAGTLEKNRAKSPQPHAIDQQLLDKMEDAFQDLKQQPASNSELANIAEEPEPVTTKQAQRTGDEQEPHKQVPHEQAQDQQSDAQTRHKQTLDEPIRENKISDEQTRDEQMQEKQINDENMSYEQRDPSIKPTSGVDSHALKQLHQDFLHAEKLTHIPSEHAREQTSEHTKAEDTSAREQDLLVDLARSATRVLPQRDTADELMREQLHEVESSAARAVGDIEREALHRLQEGQDALQEQVEQITETAKRHAQAADEATRDALQHAFESGTEHFNNHTEHATEECVSEARRLVAEVEETALQAIQQHSPGSVWETSAALVSEERDVLASDDMVNNKHKKGSAIPKLKKKK